MARPKRVAQEDRQTVEVRYTLTPAYMVTVDDPNLRGISGIGSTPREAITNLRSEVRRRYPFAQYDIIERVTRNDITQSPQWSL